MATNTPEQHPDATDDGWCCARCQSDAIDGYQGTWACMDCGAVWIDAPDPDPDEETRATC